MPVLDPTWRNYIGVFNYPSETDNGSAITALAETSNWLSAMGDRQATCLIGRGVAGGGETAVDDFQWPAR